MGPEESSVILLAEIPVAADSIRCSNVFASNLAAPVNVR